MKDIVLYDGWCPFCKSIINKIKKISNKNMSFESFRETDTYEKYGISEEALKDRLHVVEKKGRIKSGASAFLIICKNCLLLWPFVPILKTSIRIGIGEKVYDLIAKNRKIIPNSQCDMNCKVDYNVKKISKIKLSIFLFIIIIMIIVIVTLLGILSLNKKDPEFIADYLNENPEKSGLVISKNDKNIYTHNPELKLPTASLFKIIVGIELVNQYESNKIDLHEKVKISDVNKYNMTPKTNSSFIKWKKDKVKNQKTVSLYEIAKGMIQYSSNPNTDYLIDRLGNENVNNSAKKLTNNKHEKITKIYPRVIAPLYLHKVKGNNTEEVADTISKMKPTEYDKVTNRTQDALKHSKFTKEELNNYFPSEKEQVNLSNNLPKSTAQSYINILNGIENYTHNKKSQKILYNLLTIDTHSGNNVLGKNGYTINISNKAITTEQGKNKYTIVLLTSKQNSYEHEKIEKNIDFFIDDILNNKYRLIDK